MTRIVNAVIALVVASFLASCSSSGGGNNGALAFGQPSYPVTSGSTIALPLTLSGNTSTSGVTVTIASSSSTVAVPIYTPCVLSDEPGSTSSCEIQVKGLASGSATISASAPGVKGASATVSVSTTPVAGTLTFTPSAETVVVGSVQHVTVKLSGSSGVSGQSVSIASSSPTLATVTPSRVVLSTDAPAQLITVTGVAEGTLRITASSSGYVDATNAVTITSGTPVPGTLAFGGNVYLAVGGSTGGTLTLVGSSNVAPFTATLVTANTSATISPTSCPLSTTTRTCPFTITGNATGSDKITASASGYGPATMIATVSATPVPGNLYFAMAQETVVVGAPATVNLVYSGGSGVTDLPVTLSTNNGNATISPTICPMSNTSGSSTCPITITGVSAGSTTITAAATGYPSAQNTVNVQSSGQVVYGTLSFASANVPVPVNGSVQLALTLNGSSNVTNLPVSLAALPAGIVTVATTPSPCVLSTSSNTCTVTLTGAATGSTTLTATSTAGPPTPIQASAAVTVGAAPSPSLVFAPDPLVLMSNSIAGISVTLSMANPPVNPVQIALTYPQPPLAMSVTPDPCVLSAATPTCAISINNTSLSNPTGQYSFTATPLNSSIPAATLPVYVSTLQPISRTLTVTNNCPYTVWAGMSGGAVASVTPIAAAGQQACPAGTSFATGYCCPTGSSSVAGNYCYWSSPTPTSGYMLPTATGLRSTQFVIPSNSLTTAPNLTHVWSGGIMARLGCDGSGNCAIGTCNDNTSGSLACAVGVGFNPPQTVAEFTLLQGGPDAYDVQLIAGVTVPTSMGPTSPMQDGGESVHRRRGRIDEEPGGHAVHAQSGDLDLHPSPDRHPGLERVLHPRERQLRRHGRVLGHHALRHRRLRIRDELDHERAGGLAGRTDLQAGVRDATRLPDCGRDLEGQPDRVERVADRVQLATRHGNSIRDSSVSERQRIHAGAVRRLPEPADEQRLPAGDHLSDCLRLHRLDGHRDPDVDVPGDRGHGLHRHHAGNRLQLGVDPGSASAPHLAEAGLPHLLHLPVRRRVVVVPGVPGRVSHKRLQLDELHDHVLSVRGVRCPHGAEPLDVSPPYTAGSPRLPAGGRCRTYRTIRQISGSLRIPPRRASRRAKARSG